jgi:hypothetical protein
MHSLRTRLRKNRGSSFRHEHELFSKKYPGLLRDLPIFLSKGNQGLFLWGEKQQKREAGHPHPSSTEVKNVWSFTSLLSVLHDVVLN